MKRLYKDGTASDAVFFRGVEVEHTPAYRLNTLFVVGPQTLTDVRNKLKEMDDIKHIYLGANKSFNSEDSWRVLVDGLLHDGYWVTLDYPLRHHNFVMRLLNQEMRHSKFIPMISVEIPNIDSYNYNTVVKVDDLGMDESNPGVWCHSLHNLMDRKVFTPWSDYVDDEVIDDS